MILIEQRFLKTTIGWTKYKPLLYYITEKDNCLLNNGDWHQYSINDLLDKETKDKLEFGTLVHSYMERIDSVNDLNEDTLEIVRKAIAKFFSHDVFKKEIIERYHEYEFVYYEGSTKCNGIIDLLLETNDEFIIIDYKLKDIDKESYVSQINEYKKYISKISDKKVSGYLYSIILDTWKEI